MKAKPHARRKPLPGLPASKRVTVPFNGGNVEAIDLRFATTREASAELTLDDGTVLVLQIVVAGVSKLVDQKAQDGTPIYSVRSSNVLSVATQPPAKKH